MDVTQYYMRDPPIVSNNNIWLSCTGIAYQIHFAILMDFGSVVM